MVTLLPGLGRHSPFSGEGHRGKLCGSMGLVVVSWLKRSHGRARVLRDQEAEEEYEEPGESGECGLLWKNSS